MGRRLLVLLTAAVAAAASSPVAGAAGFTKTDGSVGMDDGVQLATTLYEPTGPPPPTGWPAIVMFHGLGGNRQGMNTLAENSFANEGYAVLTFDFRGHGQSGGQSSIDGPREQRDTRELYDWLAARPEIDRADVGAWGISLGGGAVWHSLVDGVPFAAAEVVETWTDLTSALAPESLSKSGAVFGFLSSLPADRIAPEVLALKDDAIASRNFAALQAFSDARSSRPALPRIMTPVFMFQGRRDFAFGIDQALAAFTQLGGPKRLYVGDFGHAPSTFPGPDVAVVLAEGADWFARFLKGQPNGIDTKPPVELAPDPFREAQNVSYAGLPPTRTVAYTLGGRTTIGTNGKILRALPRPKALLETFGPPVATVTSPSYGRWPHLVAVLTATPPGGGSVVVSEGGAATSLARNGVLTIRMIYDATTIPAGSRLRLLLAGSSLAESANNLLYLVNVPDGSRLTVTKVRLSIPVLRRPISR